MHGTSTRLSAATASLVAAAGLFALAGAIVTASSRPVSVRTATDRHSSILDGPCDDAESEARRVVSESTASHGAESPETLAAQDRLVDARLQNGKGTQNPTRELAETIVRIKETSGSPPNELATSLRNLGRVLVAAGEYQNAIPLFQRALALREKATGADDLTVAESLDDLAYVLIRAQRYEDARSTIDRALLLKDAALGSSHESVARTLEHRAYLLQTEGS